MKSIVTLDPVKEYELINYSVLFSVNILLLNTKYGHASLKIPNIVYLVDSVFDNVVAFKCISSNYSRTLQLKYSEFYNVDGSAFRLYLL